MAAETTPPSGGPAVPEIVARADGLYDANTLRDALKYLLKYEHLDEVEVRVQCIYMEIHVHSTLGFSKQKEVTKHFTASKTY